MKIAIVIPTYRRNDGSSFKFLTRALESIKNQQHTDYVVYLIGDNYSDNSEFEELSTIIEPTKIKAINLPIAIEREKYPMNSKELHCSGGVNATNIGIEMAITDRLPYICHLDHDDYWSNTHLSAINDIIEKKC